MTFERRGKTARTGRRTDAQPAPTVGKTTRVEDGARTASPGAGTTTSEASDPTPEARAARARALIEKLQKEFGRRPELAKQTATTLSAELPELYGPDWLLAMIREINDAAFKQRRVAQAERDWDRRPEPAKQALRELMQRFPRDRRLRGWCQAFIVRIDNFQDAQRVALWDRRPGDAEAAARRLHQRSPRVYTRSWLTKLQKQIRAFQDVAWAEKVSTDELRAWLGANAIEWEDAPPEVKADLMVRLGRLKRDQAFTRGGGGARNPGALAAPRTEDQRLGLLDKTDDGSSSFQWTTEGEVTLELTARQLDKQAAQSEALVTPSKQLGPSSLLLDQPDAITEILDQTFQDRASALRRSSAAYRDLARRLETGATTREIERTKLARDRAALGFSIQTLRGQLGELEKSDPDKASQLRKTLAAMQSNVGVLDQVLADPDGVIPGGGTIAAQLAEPPTPTQAYVTTARKEDVAVKKITDAIDRATGTDADPYGDGVGARTSELATGFVRFLGRLQGAQAGVFRMLTEVGSYVLPASATEYLRGVQTDMANLASALQRANSGVTAENAKGREQWTAAGGTIPRIDRIFSNEKIGERPDDALLALLSATPATAPGAMALQITLGTLGTAEAFFTTYGQSGSLSAGLSAAGWSALQQVAGLALARLGVAGDLAGNVALTYALGKLRGLSDPQIEEEIAFALVGTAVSGGAVARTASPVTNLTGKAAELMSAMARTGAQDGPAPPATTHTEDPARARQIDRVAQDLQAAMIASRELTQRLLAAQQQRRPTAQIVRELEVSAGTSRQKRAELQRLFAERRATATPEVSSAVDATVTPPDSATILGPSPATTAPTTTTARSTTATPPRDGERIATTDPKSAPEAATTEPSTTERTTRETTDTSSKPVAELDGATLVLVKIDAVGKNNAGVYTTTVDGAAAFVKVLKASDPDEVAVTQKLGELGIGPRLLGTTVLEGLPAIITERVADPVQIDRNALMISAEAAIFRDLTPAQRLHIATEIERVALLVEAHGIAVGDLQFLYSRATGKVLVIDPGQFHLLPAGKAAPLSRVEVEAFARSLRQHWALPSRGATTAPTPDGSDDPQVLSPRGGDLAEVGKVEP